MSTAADLAPEIRDSTVYWFVALETARKRGDYALAAEADAELRRLGVRVRYQQTQRLPAKEARRVD
jgi:hypothetical protein